MVSEVLKTSGTFDAADPDNPTSPPQGNMSGHGVGIISGNYGKYFCEEHGYIIGIMSVMPKTAYMQGIEKHWLKYEDPTQIYFSNFAHIGEQGIEPREVYAWDHATMTDPFGYVPRYAEYKYMNNRVAGDFRTSLVHWHAARRFSNPPELNQEFIECDAPLDDINRIFAVVDPTQDKLYAHVLNKISALRGMPKYGTPI